MFTPIASHGAFSPLVSSDDTTPAPAAPLMGTSSRSVNQGAVGSSGTAADQHLYGPATGGTWYGGGGDDTRSASDEDDVLFGGDGDDEIHGNDGDDVIYDGDGVDLAYGGAGDDLFIAEDDSDHPYQPEHDDYYYGGIGFDHISYELSSTAWLIDLAEGHAFNGDALDALHSIEGATGSNQGDFIYGNHQHNILFGLAGDDEIEGAGGDDEINGGDGIDDMDGGDGIDTLIFTDNAERVVVDLNTEEVDHFDLQSRSTPTYSERAVNFENVVGSGNADDLYGSSIANVIKGGDGDDYIHGRMGDDLLKGNAGADEIYGGKGDDDLRGGLDNDVLNGGEGVNTADGGAGDDIIELAFIGSNVAPLGYRIGGPSEDTGPVSHLTATGGEGADTFVFVDGDERTEMIVTDFDEDEDFLFFNSINMQAQGVFDQSHNIFGAYDMDTAADGWITEADDGWSLTNGGTALKFQSQDGASLVLEGVTIFDTDALMFPESDYSYLRGGGGF